MEQLPQIYKFVLALMGICDALRLIRRSHGLNVQPAGYYFNSRIRIMRNANHPVFDKKIRVICGLH